MQTEIPASFHSDAPEFLFATTDRTDSVSITAASALAIHWHLLIGVIYPFR
jgi:hypothetical protein